MPRREVREVGVPLLEVEAHLPEVEARLPEVEVVVLLREAEALVAVPAVVASVAASVAVSAVVASVVLAEVSVVVVVVSLAALVVVALAMDADIIAAIIATFSAETITASIVFTQPMARQYRPAHLVAITIDVDNLVAAGLIVTLAGAVDIIVANPFRALKVNLGYSCLSKFQ